MRLTRREAIGALALGAISTGAPKPIIRTILKDLPPEALAGGATLFHEHMSFADNFMTRWGQYARETAAARNPQAASKQGGRGAVQPAAPPPGTKYFMQDLDLM